MDLIRGTNKKILVLINGPTGKDKMSGRPLSGWKASVLDEALSKSCVGPCDYNILSINETYKSWFAYKRLFQDKACKIPTPELAFRFDKIDKMIDKLNPNIIICLGALPSVYAGIGPNVGKHRGYINKGRNDRKYIATYDMDHLRKLYGDRVIFDLDIRKACANSSSPELSYVPFNANVAPSFEETIRFLSSIKEGDVIAHDIETTWDNIRCWGLCVNGDKTIVMPFHKTADNTTIEIGKLFCSDDSYSGYGDVNYYTDTQEKAVLTMLNNIMGNDKIYKVAHNASFDHTLVGEYFGIDIKGLVGDTMLMHHAIYSELPKNLDFCISIYTDIPFYSDYNPASDKSTWTYNAWDCIGCYKIYEELDKLNNRFEVKDFYTHHIQPTMQACNNVQNTGIKIDIEKRDKLKNKYSEEMDVIITKLKDITGSDLNPNSPKQMIDFFYGDLKIKPYKDRNTMQPTVDKFALKKIKDNYPVHAELVDTITRYKKLGGYINKVLSCNLKGDRIHTSYNVAGTVNGRLASSKDLFGNGFNLQQIDKTEIRSIFITDNEDEVWIKADLSQAESMAVAWIANIRLLIDRFLYDENFDIHRWNGSNTFGIPEHEVTSKQRSLAKPGVHGGNYQLGPGTASLIYGTTYQQAKDSLNAYKNALPGLEVWWAGVDNQLHNKRMLRTRMGRIRQFTGRLDKSTLRSAIAFEPQSTVADIINRALYILLVLLEPTGFRPVLQVHDEIDFIGPKKNLGEAVSIIRNVMEYPIKYPNVKEPMCIPCDFEIGDNWYDLKDLSSE